MAYLLFIDSWFLALGLWAKVVVPDEYVGIMRMYVCVASRRTLLKAEGALDVACCRLSEAFSLQ